MIQTTDCVVVYHVKGIASSILRSDIVASVILLYAVIHNLVLPSLSASQFVASTEIQTRYVFD